MTVIVKSDPDTVKARSMPATRASCTFFAHKDRVRYRRNAYIDISLSPPGASRFNRLLDRHWKKKVGKYV